MVGCGKSIKCRFFLVFLLSILVYPWVPPLPVPKVNLDPSQITVLPGGVCERRLPLERRCQVLGHGASAGVRKIWDLTWLVLSSNGDLNR